MLIISLLLDLQEDFRMAIKQSTIRFLMRFGFDFDLAQKTNFTFFKTHAIRFFLFSRYKEQWQEFELEMDPNLIEYPIATIRGPVPWKCNFQLANNRLDQVLMVTHPVLQAMNRLWYEL